MAASTSYLPLECDSKRFDGTANLSSALHRIVDNPDESSADVFFEVGAKRFGGLRCLISLQSDLLKQMLNSSFKEAEPSSCIRLSQFDHIPEVIGEFLKFLHTGQISLGASVMHLYEVADYFQALGLKKACLEHVQSIGLTTENAAKILWFSERYCLPSDNVKEFIKANADEVLVSTEDQLCLLLLPFLRELYITDDATVKELTLLRTLLKLPADAQSELASFIRLPLIPTKQIMTEALASGLFSERQCLDAVAFQADRTSVTLAPELIKKRGEKEKKEKKEKRKKSRSRSRKKNRSRSRARPFLLSEFLAARMEERRQGRW